MKNQFKTKIYQDWTKEDLKQYQALQRACPLVRLRAERNLTVSKLALIAAEDGIKPSRVRQSITLLEAGGFHDECFDDVVPGIEALGGIDPEEMRQAMRQWADDFNRGIESRRQKR